MLNMERDTTKSKSPVVVAMSGGVDSCAAAIILAEQGHPIIGVSMQVWDYRKNGGNAARATCCAPSDFDDARHIAHTYNFPFYVFDFEDSFYENVISPFVNSYLEGYTPNPCMDCNRKVKFNELRVRAKSLGYNTVATGHYAQVKKLPNNKLGLFTSADCGKDQSYFLYAMTQHDLEHTLFPVGGMQKSEVRNYLQSRGLKVASKPESQDICFIGSTVGEFIQQETDLGKIGNTTNGSKTTKGGKITDSGGNVLGEHGGIHNFTVGQRRGIGLSAESPLYVINIDAGTNEVQVGPKQDLQRENFTVRDVNWISGEVPAHPVTANVKLRYRHPGVECKIEPLNAESAKISFVNDWSSVSPGQAAVFYSTELDADGSLQVIGGGIINK